MDDDMLVEMLRAQRELQIGSFGLDPSELGEEDRMEFIRWNTLALVAELAEMLDETGWKPWASSAHVNVAEALGEMVDAWHFFMNLLWAIEGGGCLGDAGVLAEVFTQRYHDKHAVNAERQRDGYDGVSGKCSGCHRDLAEIQLVAYDLAFGGQITACSCGKIVDPT